MTLPELIIEFDLMHRSWGDDDPLYRLPLDNVQPLVAYLSIMFPNVWKKDNEYLYDKYYEVGNRGDWMVSLKTGLYDPKFLQRLIGEKYETTDT